jgi:3-methylcrotonyl-CoA carboxylase beta subunit
MQDSFMKVVGGDVDTSSSDYQENYQKMMQMNDQLDEITRKMMDVG